MTVIVVPHSPLPPPLTPLYRRLARARARRAVAAVEARDGMGSPLTRVCPFRPPSAPPMSAPTSTTVYCRHLTRAMARRAVAEGRESTPTRILPYPRDPSLPYPLSLPLPLLYRHLARARAQRARAAAEGRRGMGSRTRGGRMRTPWMGSWRRRRSRRVVDRTI